MFYRIALPAFKKTPNQQNKSKTKPNQKYPLLTQRSHLCQTSSTCSQTGNKAFQEKFLIGWKKYKKQLTDFSCCCYHKSWPILVNLARKGSLVNTNLITLCFGLLIKNYLWSNFLSRVVFTKLFPHCNHISTGIMTRSDHINNWVSVRAMTPLAASSVHPEPPPLWRRHTHGQPWEQKLFSSFAKDFVKIRPKNKVPDQSKPPRKLGIKIYKFQTGFCLWKTQAVTRLIFENSTTKRHLWWSPCSVVAVILVLPLCVYGAAHTYIYLYLLSDSSGKLV